MADPINPGDEEIDTPNAAHDEDGQQAGTHEHGEAEGDELDEDEQDENEEDGAEA